MLYYTCTSDICIRVYIYSWSFSLVLCYITFPIHKSLYLWCVVLVEIMWADIVNAQLHTCTSMIVVALLVFTDMEATNSWWFGPVNPNAADTVCSICGAMVCGLFLWVQGELPMFVVCGLFIWVQGELLMPWFVAFFFEFKVSCWCHGLWPFYLSSRWAACVCGLWPFYLSSRWAACVCGLWPFHEIHVL